MAPPPRKIRNIAIIAHVDHGKTTLVDHMLRQAGAFQSHERVEERVMDSNPLERERGITILSKNTAVRWGETRINIVDTPGHADFGGEVERILRMVDGVLLLVDAAEGPMPQTRFVTRKALALGLAPIVVINKVDRPEQRAAEVHDEVLELFMELDATEAQLDAPFLYASGRDGWASPDIEARDGDLEPLFETIVAAVPSPAGDPEGPFQMLASTLDHSSYVGRIAIGRIERGTVAEADRVVLLPLGEPGPVSADEAIPARVLKIYGFDGLKRVETPRAGAGDIVALAGLDGVEIGQTIAHPDHRERLRGIAVERPTLSVDFRVNDAPFAGRTGKYVTTRQLRQRLFRELERNVALRVEPTDAPDTFSVSGRGELHLTILMETMRREGYEFSISRPRVILREGPDGEVLEPYEEAVIEVPSQMVGVVMEKMGSRRADLVSMRPTDQGPVRLDFKLPSRGLFGYRSEFLTDTRGEGQLHHRFLEYGPRAGRLEHRRKGVLVADRPGTSVSFALFNLQERAEMLIGPGVEVYSGMIVGEHVRPGDLEVNVSKGKKLTNMRAAAADENVRLEPPRELTLELALEFINDDELIEVTPDAIRLRKRKLDPIERKKAMRRAAAEAREG
ncbi:translational GTPase TypA [Candidatus Palauibacter sp.]|uniref:translational GTPase TypA n=1 Tax=Candidatus Palauibacter sp. TaxID=3101350 RepID=UPI003B526113